MHDIGFYTTVAGIGSLAAAALAALAHPQRIDALIALLGAVLLVAGISLLLWG